MTFRFPCFNPRPHRGAGATDRAVDELGDGIVSILARTEARALPRFALVEASGQIVSILARTEARALHRRCHIKICWFSGFNPRPHRGAGATHKRIRNYFPAIVSILARTEARALQHGIQAACRCIPVSILARTEARALPRGACRSARGIDVSILARTEARALHSRRQRRLPT